MKNYYVILINEESYDETVSLVTDDAKKAKEHAADEQYYIKRDGREDERVEIRSYAEDIEKEDCDCFDYDLIEF